jgi:hypothetical protein
MEPQSRGAIEPQSQEAAEHQINIMESTIAA